MRTTSGFLASLQRLSKEAAASGKEPPLAKGEAEYAARLGKLRIGETEVAKVVPDRIYSVAVLPSASSVVAAVGDRSGNLGIWNYSNQDSLEEKGRRRDRNENAGEHRRNARRCAHALCAYASHTRGGTPPSSTPPYGHTHHSH